MIRSARIRNVLAGAAVCSALGFGTLSATARPEAPHGSRFNCPPSRTYDGCVLCCGTNGQTVYSWSAVTGACECTLP